MKIHRLLSGIRQVFLIQCAGDDRAVLLHLGRYLFCGKEPGRKRLAALNLAIPVYSFLHGSGLMIGMGGATRYAILKSQKNSQGADRMFTHAILLAAGFALFFMLAGGVLSGPIVTLFGADENVFEMTKTYVQVILLFAPAFLLNNVRSALSATRSAPSFHGWR